MKTSWNEIRWIEEQLLANPIQEERLLFQAKLLIQPNLNESVEWQHKTYQLIRDYGRQKVRQEIAEVTKELFTKPQHRSFRQKIKSLFHK